MTLALDRPFEPRLTAPQKRAQAAHARLCWAVLAMVLLNAVVWGGMIGAARGLVDVHQLVDQVWAQGTAGLAAIPFHLNITITH
jgi:hypothetical protein